MAQGKEIVGYEFGNGLYADLERKCVFLKGSPLPGRLTNKEFEVLVFFLERPGITIAPKEVDPLHGPYSQDPIYDYIAKIRRKLQLRPQELLVSEKGAGYRAEGRIKPRFRHELGAGADFLGLSEQHFNLHRTDSMEASIQQAEEALRLDPTLVDAHVNIAYSCISLCQSAFARLHPQQAIPKAKAAAETALQLRPDFSPAIGILGLINFVYEYNWERAGEFLRRAIAINPQDAATLLVYSHLLVATGRRMAAIECIEKAAAADPSDQIIWASRSWINLLAGNISAAIKLGQQSLVRFPILAPGHLMLGWAYQASNSYDVALQHYERSLEIEFSPEAVAALGHLHATLGHRGTALSHLSDLNKAEENGRIAYLPAFCEALIYAGMGDPKSALKSLSVAYKQRCNWLTLLRVEPRWSSLRHMSKFQEIVRLVGIPDRTSVGG